MEFDRHGKSQQIRLLSSSLNF